MFVASVKQEGDSVTGWVSSMEDGLNTAIICQRDDNGTWVPSHGIDVPNKRLIELPPCFALMGEAATALEDAYTARN